MITQPWRVRARAFTCPCTEQRLLITAAWSPSHGAKTWCSMASQSQWKAQKERRNTAARSSSNPGTFGENKVPSASSYTVTKLSTFSGTSRLRNSTARRNPFRSTTLRSCASRRWCSWSAIWEKKRTEEPGADPHSSTRFWFRRKNTFLGRESSQRERSFTRRVGAMRSRLSARTKATTTLEGNRRRQVGFKFSRRWRLDWTGTWWSTWSTCNGSSEGTRPFIWTRWEWRCIGMCTIGSLALVWNTLCLFLSLFHHPCPCPCHHHRIPFHHLRHLYRCRPHPHHYPLKLLDPWRGLVRTSHQNFACFYMLGRLSSEKDGVSVTVLLLFHMIKWKSEDMEKVMQCWWWRLRLVWEVKEKEREKGGGARERVSYSWGQTIVHNGQNGLNHRHMPNNSACVHVYLHLSILSLDLILRRELCIWICFFFFKLFM